MFHDEYTEFLKRQNKTNYQDYKNYYILRKLKRYFIQIDRKILENQKNEFLIVHSEEEFIQKRHEQPDKCIYYLKDENQNLLLQKSKGPISNLNEFIINLEHSWLTVDEKNILNPNESILIISAEPGMGKSTLFNKLVYDSTSEHFYLIIFHPFYSKKFV